MSGESDGRLDAALQRIGGRHGGRDLDELFGEGGGAARPRRGLIVGLVGVGSLLAVLGMACTPAIGGVLILLGLSVAEKESARVESGYLPVSERATVRRLRALALAAVLGAVGLFVVQLVLLTFGVYNTPWMAAVEQLAAWREQVYPAPEPPADPGAPAPPGSPAPGSPAPHGGAAPAPAPR